MNHFLAVSIVLLSSLPALASEATLKEARQRWLRGNYEEARSKYESLIDQPKYRIAAEIGIARTLQHEGKHEDALKRLDALPDEVKNHPDILATRADLLYERGQWDEALTAAGTAIQRSRDHFLARWVRARILRDKGDAKAADTEMRWFVRTYTQRSNDDADIENPDELLLVGLAGAENARWHRLSDQFRFIINEVFADALKFDKDFWPAECTVGWMLLEKYNKPDALEAFDKALKMNPKAVDALVGKGVAALQNYELKDAESFAEAALKWVPNFTPALRLKADVYLAGNDLTTAFTILQTARKINPREVATLARIAAIHQIRKDAAAFTAIIDEVKSFDAQPGIFYHELAACLEDRKFYALAEQYYQQAMKLRPMIPGPQSALGLLYLRLGKEKEGRAALTAAFEADPFHVRVANSLKVLRHLDNYTVKLTPHFELRYDAKRDAVLAEFLAEYLEEVYDDLAQQFQYQPPERILIEVFNSHEMFSGRTIGVPDLHTIGACTGKVIAMASPHADGVRKPFGWTRVVRHELVHIFNLSQTNFQIPHWLTEGLAVRNEGIARPPSWLTTLATRIRRDELLNLDTIMLGFVRPRSPEEWTLAYCQSELYVDYIIRTYGADKIAGLLAAYRDGLETREALRKVLGVEQAELEKGYRAFIEKIAAPAMNEPTAEKPMSFAQLQEAHEATPDDVDISARLAEQLLRRERNREARQLVDAVLAKKPGHPLASIVKAKLLALAGEEQEANALIDAAIKQSPNDLRLLKLTIDRAMEAKDYASAVERIEKARKLAPYAGPWLEMLADAYEKMGKMAELGLTLRELANQDADDATSRLKLAEMLLKAGQFAAAEEAAREVLHIDVKNVRAREIFLESLDKQQKMEELAKYRQRFGS